MALKGEKQLALDCLERLLDLDFKDVGHLERDSSLTALRSEDRYQKLVEKLKRK